MPLVIAPAACCAGMPMDVRASPLAAAPFIWACGTPTPGNACRQGGMKRVWIRMRMILTLSAPHGAEHVSPGTASATAQARCCNGNPRKPGSHHCTASDLHVGRGVSRWLCHAPIVPIGVRCSRCWRCCRSSEASIRRRHWGCRQQKQMCLIMWCAGCPAADRAVMLLGQPSSYMP